MSCALFSPIRMRGMTLANRIAIAPMDQFSAADGLANDWHLMHYGQLAVSGTGLMIVEATAVEAEGRISPGCIGLYNDECERTLGRVAAFCRDYGNVGLGIQLAHAGRKASMPVPWRAGGGPVPADEGGWSTVGPSTVPFADEGWPLPRELDADGLARIKEAFVQAAARAGRIGFELIELHAAHGYLMHQFLSPLSNRRTDQYGGSLENRMRFPLEIFAAVRDAWPDDKPVGVRVSASDWIDGGWNLDETIALAQVLQEIGCDFIHVSSGGLSPEQKIPGGFGYQVGLGAKVKAATTMPVITVGQINGARQAETIVNSGQADMVALGRGMLFDPHWTWRAAIELGGEAAYPRPYERAQPTLRGFPVPGNPPPPRK